MKIQFRAFSGVVDWGWVKQRLPLKQVEDTMGIMAIDLETNATIGACIMEHWTRTSVHIHFMMDSPLLIRHGFFEEIADFVYNVAEREIAIGTIPSNIEASIALAKHVGFEEICRIPGAMDVNVDTVILTIRKEQCRFYQPRPRQLAVA